MKRLIMMAVAAVVLTLTLAIPAQADTVIWRCSNVPDGSGGFVTVDFVTASAAARHGIDTANRHAGQVFNLKFGEVCTVVTP